jgi:hypothetical protein
VAFLLSFVLECFANAAVAYLACMTFILLGDQQQKKRSLSIVVGPSSALLRGTMLTTPVNWPAGRPLSPYIRTKNASLHGTANGSAGVHSAPDMHAGVNSTAHLADSAAGIMIETLPSMVEIPSGTQFP